MGFLFPNISVVSGIEYYIRVGWQSSAPVHVVPRPPSASQVSEYRVFWYPSTGTRKSLLAFFSFLLIIINRRLCINPPWKPVYCGCLSTVHKFQKKKIYIYLLPHPSRLAWKRPADPTKSMAAVKTFSSSRREPPGQAQLSLLREQGRWVMTQLSHDNDVKALHGQPEEANRCTVVD